MIQVYHLTDFSLSVYAYGMTQHVPVFPEDFTLVANIIPDDYEIAYRLTQNIGRSWTNNRSPFLHAHVESARSTSMGDIMVKGDGKKAEEIVYVSGFGYKPFTNIKTKK